MLALANALGAGGLAPPGFSPADIASLNRWLQGADAGTGAITSWTAEEGVSLSAGTGSAAASYANGKKAVTFDGAAQRLGEVTSTDLASAAVEFTLAATVSLDYLSTVMLGKDNGAWVQHSAQVMYFQPTSGLYSNLGFNIGYTGLVRIVARFNGAGATSALKLRMWFDGVERTLVCPTGMPANVSLTNGFHVGGIPSLSMFSPCAVFDVQTYTSALTDEEIESICAWQAAQFAPRMVLCIGDSITAGHSVVTPRLAWPNVLAGLAGVRDVGCDVRTCAVSGYTLDTINTYATTHGWPWLLDTNQAVRSVIIAVGTNDLGTTATMVTTATALTRLDTLIAAARAGGATHVYVAHVLPRKDVANMGVSVVDFEIKRAAYLAGLVTRLGTSAIDGILRPDLATDLLDPDGAGYQDKIHPSAAGEIAFAARILSDLGGSMLP